MNFHFQVKDLIQIRLITLILKLLLAVMDMVFIIDEWEKLETIASKSKKKKKKIIIVVLVIERIRILILVIVQILVSLLIM